MARKTHKTDPEPVENIHYRLVAEVDPMMSRFLEVEAKRLSERLGRYVHPNDIVRALIAAYYEKRMAGLMIDPDD